MVDALVDESVAARVDSWVVSWAVCLVGLLEASRASKWVASLVVA